MRGPDASNALPDSCVGSALGLGAALLDAVAVGAALALGEVLA